MDQDFVENILIPKINELVKEQDTEVIYFIARSENSATRIKREIKRCNG